MYQILLYLMSQYELHLEIEDVKLFECGLKWCRSHTVVGSVPQASTLDTVPILFKLDVHEGAVQCGLFEKSWPSDLIHLTWKSLDSCFQPLGCLMTLSLCTAPDLLRRKRNNASLSLTYTKCFSPASNLWSCIAQRTPDCVCTSAAVSNSTSANLPVVPASLPPWERASSDHSIDLGSWAFAHRTWLLIAMTGTVNSLLDDWVSNFRWSSTCPSQAACHRPYQSKPCVLWPKIVTFIACPQAIGSTHSTT